MITDNTNGFIKVHNREAADYLISLGYQYIKEGDVFAFRAAPDLVKILAEKFDSGAMLVESKLRF